MLAALPLTTKVSGKIEQVITRKLQSDIDHFFPSSTDTARKVLFEQSPSSALSVPWLMYTTRTGAGCW